MKHDDNTYHLWTKKVESHTQGTTSTTRTTFSCCTGGPGLNSQYFECFESFLPPNGYTIYYYNQLDSVFSTRLMAEQRKTIYSIEYYTDHVEQVRMGLGIDKLTLLG